MQATAHFEQDFHSLIADAKQASLDALMGETPENWALISTGPRNVAWFDAWHYVETNFPNCDSRRRKREYRKALKRAYVGELPKVRVTSDPIELGNSFETVTITRPIGPGRWLDIFGEGKATIAWSQRAGEIVDLDAEGNI